MLYVFYVLSFAKFDDYRCMLAAIIVMTLVFGVDAFVLWFGRFIPLYIVVMRKTNNILNMEKNNMAKVFYLTCCHFNTLEDLVAH